MSTLEEQFHQAMVNIYDVAKRDCKYNATYFIQMILDHGGLETAKRLLASDKPSDGFSTLYLCQRLDLTVEAHVIQPEFASLFTPEEIAIARNRLKEFGFKFSDEK